MIKLTLQKSNVTKSIDEGFKEFYRFCRVKNLAKPTLEYYEVIIDNFSKFLPLDNQISRITNSTIEDYILFLRDNTNLNDTSINTKLKGLRVIIYYWMELEYLNQCTIYALRAEKKLKEPIQMLN